MPTALAEWTTERPDVPGFYWWRAYGKSAEVVELCRTSMPNGTECWEWYLCGDEVEVNDADATTFALWWPVRLDPPPVG